MPSLDSVKCDCNTNLERVLSAACATFGLLGLVLTQIGYFGYKSEPPQPVLLSLVPFLFGAALFFYLARRQVDNFYLIDQKHQQVYFHFGLFRYSSERLLYSKGDVHGVSVQTQEEHDRSSRWWVYRIVLITNKCRLVPITDWTCESLADFNSTAIKLANMLECRYYTLEGTAKLSASRERGIVTVKFIPRKWGGLTRGELIMVSIVSIVVLVFILLIVPRGI
jgi:hypothetical protein